MTRLYELSNDALVEVAPGKLANENMIQNWIADRPELLGLDLLDQAEVAERSVAKAKGPWSGLWYVNVGEGPHRSWGDMQRYGFICAGGGEKYSGPLSHLHPGDRIVAYQKGAGYVGYGVVTAAPVVARDFQTKNGPLLEQPLDQPGIARPLVRMRPEPSMSSVSIGSNRFQSPKQNDSMACSQTRT